MLSSSLTVTVRVLISMAFPVIVMTAVCAVPVLFLTMQVQELTPLSYEIIRTDALLLVAFGYATSDV